MFGPDDTIIKEYTTPALRTMVAAGKDTDVLVLSCPWIKGRSGSGPYKSHCDEGMFVKVNVQGCATGDTAGGGSTSTFTGKFTVSLDGANKEQMETATKKTLAKHFVVDESVVTTTATESRRLSEARNLAGSWSSEYSFTVPTSKAAAVESKVTAIKASSDAMKAVLKTQLIDAGVDETKVNAMTISGFTSTKTVSEASTTGVESTSPSVRHFLSVGVMMITMNLMMRGR
jgi:hypothetical protein